MTIYKDLTPNRLEQLLNEFNLMDFSYGNDRKLYLNNILIKSEYFVFCKNKTKINELEYQHIEFFMTHNESDYNEDDGWDSWDVEHSIAEYKINNDMKFNLSVSWDEIRIEVIR